MLTSILLILWKETESCTPFMSAFYILCLVVSLGFFCLFVFLAPSIDIYKHNMGIMVLQTRLPLMGIFKQTDMTLFIQVLCVGFGDESVCSATPV